MKGLLWRLLTSQKRKRVETKRIENEMIQKMGNEEYWRQGGYITFVHAITELVELGKIRPIKAWKVNGMTPSLYNGYHIVTQNKKLHPNDRQALLPQYHPAMHTGYYLRNPEVYQSDQPYMTILDRFLKQRDQDGPAFMSVNERSFQLFHDEKWLTSSQGRKILNRTGLDWEDLYCYPTNEPFFYYQRSVDQLKDPVYVLIIENKDTFFSMKKLFQEEIYTWDGKSFDLLIYGEGHKIEKSLSFFGELKDFQHRDVLFYYFGDLDPEGIYIWYQLNNQATCEIHPFRFLYQKLFNECAKDAPKRKKQQHDDPEAIQHFLAYFPQELTKGIQQLLDQGRYLPQEGLNIQRLKALSKIP